jgi:hypothetical protein
MERNFHPAGAIGAAEPNHARIMQWRFSSHKLNRFNEFHDPYLRGHAESVRTFDRPDPIGLTPFCAVSVATARASLRVHPETTVHNPTSDCNWPQYYKLMDRHTGSAL